MRNRAQIANALVLIGIGAWFLAVQLSPVIKDFAYGAQTWPWQIIGVGAFLALLGLVLWLPGMLIPASIVAGVGGLLYYQNSTGNWESWAYAWTFIPGFVGVGLLLAGLMQRSRGMLLAAGWVILSSLGALVIFGFAFGRGDALVNAWPALLILLGAILIGQSLIRR